jgi:hypothetical protein
MNCQARYHRRRSAWLVARRKQQPQQRPRPRRGSNRRFITAVPCTVSRRQLANNSISRPRATDTTAGQTAAATRTSSPRVVFPLFANKERGPSCGGPHFADRTHRERIFVFPWRRALTRPCSKARYAFWANVPSDLSEHYIAPFHASANKTVSAGDFATWSASSSWFRRSFSITESICSERQRGLMQLEEHGNRVAQSAGSCG